jgi:hypothetical protein
MNVPMALRRLWIQITADRRRFGLFCAMLGVGLLLWARLIVITNTPRTAVADDKSKQAAQTTQVPPTSRTSTASTSGPSERPKTPLRSVLATSPQRDPFVISDSHFPKAAEPANDVQEPAKFPGEPAEDSEQTRLARLAHLAERLKLEAIMSPGSGQPLVVINARTYRLNDEVPVPSRTSGEEHVRFRLVLVGERFITLEHDGHRFERTLRGVMSE